MANPGGNGAKIRLVYAVYCFIAPEGLKNLAQGFNPGKHTNKAVRPERARDGVGEMPLRMLQKGNWAFLRQKIQSPVG